MLTGAEGSIIALRMTTKADTPAVQAEELSHRFGRHWALAHLNLTVGQGEAVLLAGPNGSGKTTLLRLLSGLYRPTRGHIEIVGLDPRKDRMACRRALSLVSHHSFLYDRMTALEMTRIWARLLGVPRRDQDLVPLLEEVGLADRRDVPVGGFSAGMRKRLTLLRTRLKQPRLVLLDEPFAALDVPGQRLVEDWIERYREEGRSVVIASHDLERSARLTDRAVLLKQGQKVWEGRSNEVVGRFEELR